MWIRPRLGEPPIVNDAAEVSAKSLVEGSEYRARSVRPSTTEGVANAPRSKDGNFGAYEDDKRRRLGDAADWPTRLSHKKLTR